MTINSLNGVQNFYGLQNSEIKRNKVQTNQILSNDEKVNQSKIAETFEPQKQMLDAQIALASYAVPTININNLKKEEKEQSLSDMFIQIAKDNGLKINKRQLELFAKYFDKYIENKSCNKEECADLFKKFAETNRINIFVDTISHQDNLERAICLQKYEKLGLISKEGYQEILQDNFNDNDLDNFFQIAINKDFFNEITEIAKTRAKDNYDKSDYKTKLFANGLDITMISGLEDIYGFNLENIVLQLDKNCIIDVNGLQNTSDIEFKVTKSENDLDSGVITTTLKSFDKDGNIVLNEKIQNQYPIVDVNENGNWTINGKDTEIKADNKDSIPKITTDRGTKWVLNGANTRLPITGVVQSEINNRKMITDYSDDGRNIKSQIEIINDKNGNSEYIIYSKASEILPGVFETVKYNINDYPKDMDILNSIKDGTIKGGEIISSVQKNDNSIEYSENIENNGTITNRNYVQGDNFSQYDYVITNEEGMKILDIHRSFTTNNNGSTTTKINDKIYNTIFDDDNMHINIVDDEGNETYIDLKEKFDVKYFRSKEEDKIKFFDFIKTLPADEILILNKNTDIITFVPDVKSGYNPYFDANDKRLDAVIGKSVMQSGFDSSILSHELGHSIDFGKSEDMIGKISTNKELIEIYNKEIEKFKNTYRENNQLIIEYFGQQVGGDANDGLSELVAEAHAITTTYGHTNELVQTRAQFAAKYFPQTIAKTAELLEKAQ